MFEPIDLSFYADTVLDELVSGEPKIDNTLFFDIVSKANGPILELGCGYGRVTIPLAQRGIGNLTGLELSAPSLAYARVRAGDLPIRWVEADVRNFHLCQFYALIFARGCVFDFMLSRLDQEAMLACVREHLADDGQFMFDTCEYLPSQMVNAPEETAWFNRTHPNGREVYFSGTSCYDYTQQHWIQVGYERWDEPGGELVRSPWKLTLRYSMPQEIEALLHYNGFTVVSSYCDYQGTLSTAKRPPSLFICEKR